MPEVEGKRTTSLKVIFEPLSSFRDKFFFFRHTWSMMSRTKLGVYSCPSLHIAENQEKGKDKRRIFCPGLLKTNSFFFIFFFLDFSFFYFFGFFWIFFFLLNFSFFYFLDFFFFSIFFFFFFFCVPKLKTR